MHSAESRSSGHSDTDLEVLPAKSVPLSAAKRLLVRLHDENADEMSSLSDSKEEGVSHSQSHDPAIKKEPQCIPKRAQTSRAISWSITKEFESFEATGEKTANITKTSAALESIPPTSVEVERAFSAVGLFIMRLRTRLSDKSANCLSIFQVDCTL